MAGPQFEDGERLPDGSDPGPWQSTKWANTLCSPRLSHLRYLIISTPVMPFWPPTWTAVDRLHTAWFKGIPEHSQLQKVIIRCGSANDNLRISEYTEEALLGDEIPDGLVGGYCSERGLSNFFPTVAWTREMGSTPSKWCEADDADCPDSRSHLFFEFPADKDSMVFGHEDVLTEVYKRPLFNTGYLKKRRC
jgi:hypothetical protein